MMCDHVWYVILTPKLIRGRYRYGGPTDGLRVCRLCGNWEWTTDEISMWHTLGNRYEWRTVHEWGRYMVRARRHNVRS